MPNEQDFWTVYNERVLGIELKVSRTRDSKHLNWHPFGYSPKSSEFMFTMLYSPLNLFKDAENAIDLAKLNPTNAEMLIARDDKIEAYNRAIGELTKLGYSHPFKKFNF